MDYKLCPHCKKYLAISKFHKDKSRKDGVYSYCKKCNYINSRLCMSKKPEHYKKYHEIYNKEHQKKRREKRIKYKILPELQKENIRNHNRIHRAKKRNQRKYMLTIKQINDRVIICGTLCVYCGNIYQAIDHVIPLSKNGTDEIYNLVPACSHCNHSKNAQEWHSWFRKQPFYNQNKEIEIEHLIQLPE